MNNALHYTTRSSVGLIVFLAMLLGSCGDGGGGSVADTSPPTILSVSPASGATAVTVSTSIGVTFSEGMDASTINPATFSLSGFANVSGSVSYDAASRTAIFTPLTPLSGSTSYTAIVTTGVKDLAGNALQVNHSWSFTTADTLPPTVISTLPASNATAASVNAPIEISFSELMDIPSVNDTTLIVSTGGAVISGVITSVGAAASHFTFTPSVALGFNTTYTVTVTTGVKDLAGNFMQADYTWSFTTEAAPDTTPPTVISVFPADGTAGIAVNTIASVNFSEAMDPSTIDTTTFTLKDSTNNPVSGAVAYSGTTATFEPSVALASSTTYTATISTGAKDLAGNAMTSNYSWSFTTGIAPDITPPSVVSTVPANGATGVALNSTVSATFSEALDPATINESTFFVRYGTFGAYFSGTVSYSGVIATFTPVGLPYDASLTGLITTGVKDTSNNAMASNYTWGFRTALPPQGALDTAFGTAGKVTTDISGLSDLSGNGDRANALVIQPDGKIVATGTSYAGPGNLDDLTLARYNTDGTLDSSFGSGGKIITDFGGDDYLSRRGLVMQPDNKLVVAGTSYVGCCGDFVLARYDTNGALDTTFGTNGKVKTDFNNGNDAVFGLGIQSSGKLIVGGSGGVPGSGILVRYNSNGTLDTSFGTGGQITDAAGFSALAIQPDDKIVILNGGSVARYSASGILDATFGTAGKTAPIDIYFIYAMTIQADGKIVVAGSDFNPYKFAVVRYNANGTPDGSFGSSGKVTTEFGGLSTASAAAVSVQPDGQIVLAGGIYYLNSNDKPADFALARYNADGTLDTTFGSGGLATTDFDNGSDSIEALAIQPNGKIVAAGRSNADFALVRYLVK